MGKFKTGDYFPVVHNNLEELREKKTKLQFNIWRYLNGAYSFRHCFGLFGPYLQSRYDVAERRRVSDPAANTFWERTILAATF